MVDQRLTHLDSVRAAINVHLLWREACVEWGNAVGGPDEYEIFADKLIAALSLARSMEKEQGCPAGLLERVKAAEQRIADNHAPRRIPADPHGDVDLVLAEVRYLIEGRWPPFWIKDASDAAPVSQEDA